MSPGNNRKTIRLKGTLDSEFAERVISEIKCLVGEGIYHILLDCSGIGGCFFDDLKVFFVKLHDLYRENSAQIKIELYALPEEMSLQCQLLGEKVREKSIVYSLS